MEQLPALNIWPNGLVWGPPAIMYVVAAAVVLLLHLPQVPAAFAMILRHAFEPVAAAGGVSGATMFSAMLRGGAWNLLQ